MTNQIPKVIHYIWFGGKPLPKLTLKCMASWQKFLPKYTIKRWDESNFPTEEYRFCQEALACKKHAFASDVARAHILYYHGGIYLDTDMEILKNIDAFLDCNAFSGYGEDNNIEMGIIGSEKGGQWVSDILKYYKERPFILPKGKMDITPIPNIVSHRLKAKGIILNGSHHTHTNYITLYPKWFFYPITFSDRMPNITENTYAIHHYSASWHSITDKLRYNKRLKKIKEKNPLLFKVGKSIYSFLKNLKQCIASLLSS